MKMAKQNPIRWFEIPVKDMDRARAFYETALGYPLTPPMDMLGMSISFFPMERDVVGAGGALIKTERVEPSAQGTNIYFGVDAIDPVAKRIESAGGKVCMPRTSIGEYGFILHFIDTEGNRVALHELTTDCGK
jgi:uncharacterized protein